MKISSAGYTRCPSCLSHVKAESDRVDCPFCGHRFSRFESQPILGGGTDSFLSKSRAGLVALGLVGMTMAVACSDDDTNKDNNETNNQTNEPIAQPDYGGFPVDPDFGVERDMGVEDVGEDAEDDLSEQDMSEDAGADG